MNGFVSFGLNFTLFIIEMVFYFEQEPFFFPATCYFFYFINVSVWTNLCISQLILQNLKLKTM